MYGLRNLFVHICIARLELVSCRFRGLYTTLSTLFAKPTPLVSGPLDLNPSSFDFRLRLLCLRLVPAPDAPVTGLPRITSSNEGIRAHASTKLIAGTEVPGS